MNHAEAVRLLLGDRIYNVKCKVEFLGILESNALRIAVLALFDRDEVRDKVRGTQCGRGDLLLDHIGRNLGSQTAFFPFHLGSFLGKDDSQEADILSTDCDDAVRIGGVIENAVAGMEDFLIILDLDLHGSLKDIVEFLTGMRDLLDRLVLLCLIIVVDNEVRVCNPVLKERSNVLDQNARLLRGELSSACAGQSIARQKGCTAFQKLHDFYVEYGCAFMNERERQIRPSALIIDVIREGETGHVRHLLLCVTTVNTKRHDTAGDFLFHVACCSLVCCVCRHFATSSFLENKNPSQRIL